MLSIKLGYFITNEFLLMLQTLKLNGKSSKTKKIKNKFCQDYGWTGKRVRNDKDDII